MKTMQRLIFFDLKKLGTEKMNFLLPVLFFFMLATPLFFSNTDSSTNMKLSQLQTMLATRKQAADSMALDPNAQAALKKVQTGNHYLENLITAISEKDQKKELTAEWQFETFNLEEMENGSLVGSSLPEQRKLVAKLAYLKTHQLTKIDEMKTRIPGYNYMVKLLSGYVPIIAFVIFPCFLFVNSYMYEKRKKTNDLLNVVPVSLTKLAASKSLTTTIFGIIITLLPIMLTFVIASCQSGLGANNYPIPILQNGTVLIMSISTFLFRVGLLYVLILFFFSILSFTIALFTDSYLGHAIGLMVFILLSQYSATAQPFLEKILPLFPSAYIDSPNIILGGIYLKPLASNLLTFQNGLIVLSIYILLLLSFSGLVIYKRQRI